MGSFRQGMQACTTEVQGEWATASSANASANAKEPASQYWEASEVTLFDRDWLSAEVAGSLAACQQDWIGLLQPDWKLEPYDLSSIGIKVELSSLRHSCLSVTELVFLMRKARSQPLSLFHQQHWGYTGCLQIAGLGRVRLVACFNNSQCFGHYAVFVTNRLDWSPRRIITHWTQRRSAAVLSGRNPTFKFHSEDSLQFV